MARSNEDCSECLVIMRRIERIIKGLPGKNLVSFLRTTDAPSRTPMSSYSICLEPSSDLPQISLQHCCSDLWLSMGHRSMKTWKNRERTIQVCSDRFVQRLRRWGRSHIFGFASLADLKVASLKPTVCLKFNRYDLMDQTEVHGCVHTKTQNSVLIHWTSEGNCEFGGGAGSSPH